MSKVGERMLEGAREGLAFTEGAREDFGVHVPDHVDVRAIRGIEGLSQEAFARRYGFSASAVREWEQGRRRPERSARILLTIIRSDPDVVRRALTAA